MIGHVLTLNDGERRYCLIDPSRVDVGVVGQDIFRLCCCQEIVVGRDKNGGGQVVEKPCFLQD